MAYNWDKMVKLTIPDGMMGWHNTGYVVINGRKVEFVVGKETEVPEPVAENIYQLMSHYSVSTATAVNNGGSEYRGNHPDHNTHYVIAEVEGYSYTTNAVKGRVQEIVSEITPSTTGKHSLTLKVPAKNLLDGYDFAKHIASDVPNATLDKKNKTVRYNYNDVGSFLYKTNGLKPQTTYSVVFRKKTENTATTPNMVLTYTNGSIGPYKAFGANTWAVMTSDATKTMSGLGGYQSSGTTELLYEECGIFEGTVTIDDFEPYNPRHVATTYFPRTVYGGTYNWTTGILTVTHDLDSDSQTAVALGTPITYKLAPRDFSLVDGTNYIFCDADNTVVKYVTDSTKYIDEKFAAVSAAVIGG